MMETISIHSENSITQATMVITQAQLLEHWQGHRKVTRRAIEAFPDDKFYTYSIGGMRPFADLIMEMIGMTELGVPALITGNWSTPDQTFNLPAPPTKKEVLERWDAVTEKLNTLWPQIPPHRFQEVDTAFGQYEAPLFFTIFYWIDNEIHHRGQGYVYLRSLGIEPPPFWDR